MSTRTMVAAFAAILTAAVAAVGASAGTEAARSTVPASCDGLQYGHMGPLTGPAAVLGQGHG